MGFWSDYDVCLCGCERHKHPCGCDCERFMVMTKGGLFS
jgi:hypothetical protein